MKEKTIQKHVLAIYLNEDLGIRSVIREMDRRHHVSVSYHKVRSILNEAGALRAPNNEGNSDRLVQIAANIHRSMHASLQADSARQRTTFSKTVGRFLAYGELLHRTLREGGYVIVCKEGGQPRSITLGPRGQICEAPLDQNAMPRRLPRGEADAAV